MKRVCIIGGDNRLKTVKHHLENQNFFVSTLGLYPDDKCDISLSDVVILPVPTTRDGETVFAPLTNRRIPLSEIYEQTKDQLILCCNYNFEGRHCIDYNTLDSYALLNAVPTAEGAIKIAIENTDFTLWQSKILVIGYGRVGKILADRLKSLGAFVTVSARKPKDFAQLEALGFNYINTEDFKNMFLGYDIIFNTVDAKVLYGDTLKNLPASLLVDLSSKGGFDLEYAKALGIKALKAPALPGLTAPKTAGKILAKTVSDLIRFYN
ncbi:MAG: dipicolinate synthase subunit DpsA [Clostridia bacterium]|nr:dipicolinate synthase subunit DpsA [Clostridia bacterium]